MKKLVRRMIGVGIGLLSLSLVACQGAGTTEQKETTGSEKSEKPELVFWELP